MSEVTQIHNLTMSLDVAAEDVTQFVALFAYAGFNPEMVHEHFSKILKAKSISDSQFVSDIKTIIVLGAMKGNYTIKNSAKISEEGKKVADQLYATYQMKKGAVGAEKRSITLPRVLSAFPELTTKIVLKCPDRNYGTKTPILSKFIKNPVFAAMVPESLDSAVKAFFLELYNVYSAEQTVTIGKTKDFKEAKEDQLQYTDIAHKSSYPTEAARIAMFKAALPLLKRDVANGVDIVPSEMRITEAQLTAAVNALGGNLSTEGIV